MAISASDLERLGIREKPEVVERLILEAMSGLLCEMRPMDPGQDLTAAEREALCKGGLTLDGRQLGKKDPILRTAVDYSALVASSLTVGLASEMLGVDESRIRHRIAVRTLYGIRFRGGWRLPIFQFHGGDLLPGIEEVLPKVPRDLHPLELLNWFTSPNPELLLPGALEPVSPRDWLLAGGDPKVAARLAGEI
ncbi:MAG TPA: DNA-binding protein [Chloroflexota bacterium]|nr:DNA-binding protein [Chloroflexota bacterium]